MGSAIESILENILDGNAEMRTPKSRVEELLMQILDNKKYLHRIKIKLDGYSTRTFIFLNIYSSSKANMTAAEVYSYLAGLGPAAEEAVDYPADGRIDATKGDDSSIGSILYINCPSKGNNIRILYDVPSTGAMSMKIFNSSEGWTVKDSVISF